MFYRSLFVILSFCLFVIVFSVLIFTASAIFSFLCNVLQIIVCFQWGLCCSIFSFLCSVLQIIVCFQWGLCCSIFSFLCSVLQIIVCLILVLCDVSVARSNVFCVVFCKSLFVLYQYSVVLVLLDLMFSVQCFVDHCVSYISILWYQCCSI